MGMALTTDAATTAAVTRARHHARRAGVAVAGGITVAVGLLLIPLPGPGTLVTIAGLSILGREFPAAERAATRVRSAAGSVIRRARASIRSH